LPALFSLVVELKTRHVEWPRRLGPRARAPRSDSQEVEAPDPHARSGIPLRRRSCQLSVSRSPRRYRPMSRRCCGGCAAHIRRLAPEETARRERSALATRRAAAAFPTGKPSRPGRPRPARAPHPPSPRCAPWNGWRAGRTWWSAGRPGPGRRSSSKRWASKRSSAVHDRINRNPTAAMIGFCPPVLPRARAASRPSRVRSDIRACSNSAIAPRIWKNIRPSSASSRVASAASTTCPSLGVSAGDERDGYRRAWAVNSPTGCRSSTSHSRSDLPSRTVSWARSSHSRTGHRGHPDGAVSPA